MNLRTDGSDRPVRVLLYALDAEATPYGGYTTPAYTFQGRRWARLAYGTPTERTVGGVAEHGMPVVFQFHDQVPITENYVIVLGTTVWRVTGINDPRAYVPGQLRSVRAVTVDKGQYTLSGP